MNKTLAVAAVTAALAVVPVAAATVPAHATETHAAAAAAPAAYRWHPVRICIYTGHIWSKHSGRMTLDGRTATIERGCATFGPTSAWPNRHRASAVLWGGPSRTGKRCNTYGAVSFTGNPRFVGLPIAYKC